MGYVMWQRRKFPIKRIGRKQKEKIPNQKSGRKQKERKFPIKHRKKKKCAEKSLDQMTSEQIQNCHQVKQEKKGNHDLK